MKYLCPFVFLKVAISYCITFILCCVRIWRIPYPGSPWLLCCGVSLFLKISGMVFQCLHEFLGLGAGLSITNNHFVNLYHRHNALVGAGDEYFLGSKELCKGNIPFFNGECFICKGYYQIAGDSVKNSLIRGGQCADQYKRLPQLLVTLHVSGPGPPGYMKWIWLWEGFFPGNP